MSSRFLSVVSFIIFFFISTISLAAEDYGNAQNQEFKAAIEGGMPLSAEEEAFMQAVVPAKPYDRFYLNYQATFLGSSVAMGYKNKEVYNGATVTPATHSVSKKHAAVGAGFEGLALGYRWKTVALELAFLHSKTVKYTPNPLMRGDSPLLLSNFNARGTMLNWLFFSDEKQTAIPWFKLQPYFIGGLGYGENNLSAELNATNIADDLGNTTGTYKQKTSKLGFLLGMGGGVHARLTEHLGISLSGQLVSWPLPPTMRVPFTNTGGSGLYQVAPIRYMSVAVLLGVNLVF